MQSVAEPRYQTDLRTELVSITAPLVTDSDRIQEQVVLRTPVPRRKIINDPIIPFLVLGAATFIGMFIAAFILSAA